MGEKYKVLEGETVASGSGLIQQKRLPACLRALVDADEGEVGVFIRLNTCRVVPAHE